MVRLTRLLSYSLPVNYSESQLSFLPFSCVAKFDCTVPGTLADFTEECNITTSGSSLSMTTSTRVTTTTTTVDTDNTSNTEYGIKDIYVVVACVAALVLACVLTVFVVCIIVCLRRRKGRPHKRQTAPLGEERKSQELQCQGLAPD